MAVKEGTMTDGTPGDGDSRPGDVGQPGFGPPPYGQPSYGPPSYGQPPYSPPPYGPPPYGPPPYGPPPYGPPPYGPTGWNAPYPQPGGIPLRPLILGDILGGAFTSVRRNPTATIGLAAIALACYGLVSTGISLVQRHLLRNLPTALRPGQTPGQVGHFFSHFIAILAPTLVLTTIIALLFQAILTGLLTAVIGPGALGRRISLGDAWKTARLPRVIGAAVLITAVLAGSWAVVAAAVVVLAVIHVTLAAVLVGFVGAVAALAVTFWLSVMLSLATPAVVLEGLAPAAALRRSWRLVSGSFWRLLGIYLLTGLIVAMAALVLEIPFAIAAAITGGGLSAFGATGTVSVTSLIISAVGSVVAGSIARPVSAGVTVLLYLDMRMRKEGLDLVLQNAALSHQLTEAQFTALWSSPGPQAGPGPGPGRGPGPGSGQGPAGPAATPAAW